MVYHSADELPIATVIKFDQSIGVTARLRAMRLFLGALMFCALSFRKIIAARAHKAKALDHTLGLYGVNSGAKGFYHVIALCPAWRWRSGGIFHIGVSDDEAISYSINAKHEETVA